MYEKVIPTDKNSQCRVSVARRLSELKPRDMKECIKLLQRQSAE